jgi:hypothetical protein
MALLAFRGGYDMKVVRIGLDIAKSVFQLNGVEAHGKTVLRKTLSRGEVLRYFVQCPPMHSPMLDSSRLGLG